MSVPVVESRREIVARLSSAQKSNRGAAAYSRWVNRPLGRQIAASAYLLGLTPNQISMISAAFSYLSIAAIALFAPTWYLGVLTGLGLLLGYAFDSADGQVARLRGGGSAAGEWFDHVIDAFKISAMHAALVISWFRFFHFGHAAALLVPLGFLVVSAVFYFAITLSDLLRRIATLRRGGTGVPTSSVNPYEAAPVLRSIIVLPNDWGLLCVVVLFLGARPVFVAAYTALFVANVGFLMAGCVRWFREMDSL